MCDRLQRNVQVKDLDGLRRALDFERAFSEEVSTEKTMWESPIFQAKHLEVELADGIHGWRDIVLHKGGAGVVALRDDGCVCLVRQYRIALGRMTLEVPAGKLDAGETEAECAARELHEETGLVAAELMPLITSLGSPGFTSEHTSIFFARGLEQGNAAPDDGEVVRTIWVPAGIAVEAVLAGFIQDAKTALGLLAARALGLF